MLKWVSRKKRKDKMKNEVIRYNLGIAYIEDKTRENRLRWFDKVYRRFDK